MSFLHTKQCNEIWLELNQFYIQFFENKICCFIFVILNKTLLFFFILGLLGFV